MKIPQARFSLKDPKAKDETLIYMFYRLPNKSKRIVFSTQEYCLPKYWDNNNRKVKNSIAYTKGAATNKKLQQYAQLAENLYAEFKGEIEPTVFKKELEFRSGRKQRQPKKVRKKKKPVTFLEFIEKHIASESDKPNAIYGTWKKYLTVFNHLKNFHESTKTPINFKDINWHFRTEFEKWLYSPPRNHSANNVSKIFQVIKTFMKLSHREKLHTNEIYKESDFGVKRVKVKTKIRLTPEEVNTLIATNFSDNNHYDRVRDMFIAACFSGLRISDWKSIDKQHIITVQGMDFLNLMMEKTKKEISIPIMEELRKVLKKYDYQMPVMTPQVFNRTLKEVLKRAIPDSTFLRIYSEGGSTKSEKVPKWQFASSHAGRRTFASNRYMEGWSLRKIMNILGHASEKQTEEYMDISDWELSIRDGMVVQMVEAAKKRKKNGQEQFS